MKTKRRDPMIVRKKKRKRLHALERPHQQQPIPVSRTGLHRLSDEQFQAFLDAWNDVIVRDGIDANPLSVEEMEVVLGEGEHRGWIAPEDRIARRLHRPMRRVV